MAKKSKKSKKSSKNSMVYALVLLVIAIVVGCMVFVPNVKAVTTILNSTTTTKFEALPVVFGGDEKTLGTLMFNWIAALGFLLPVVGCLVYILLRALLGKGGKLFVLLPTLCFIASAVLLFLSVKGIVSANPDNGGVALYNAAESFRLDVGSIIGAIASIIGGLASLGVTYVELVK